MEPYAEVICVLKVKSNCQACKMKSMEILGSVCGMYRIDINSEEGLLKLQAVVEPNIFLKALAGTGSHAKPVSVKINHPKFYNTYNANNYYNSSRPMPHQPYPTYPYYHGSNSNYYGSGPPQQRRRGPFHY